MSVRLVDTPEGFRALLSEIAGATLVALDTEAASFHRYHDRIYLVQLSTPALTAVIDPLGVGDLSPIGELLANPDTEKVFHDADYDLRLFDRQFGFRATRLFDTQATIISRIGPILPSPKNMCSVRHRPIPSAPNATDAVA